MDNQKTLQEVKSQYDEVVKKIEKLLKKDDSKTLAEYQQKMTPLLAQKEELARMLDQLYKTVKLELANQRKQIKLREAEIKKQAKLQKKRKQKEL